MEVCNDSQTSSMDYVNSSDSSTSQMIDDKFDLDLTEEEAQEVVNYRVLELNVKSLMARNSELESELKLYESRLEGVSFAKAAADRDLFDERVTRQGLQKQLADIKSSHQKNTEAQLVSSNDMEASLRECNASLIESKAENMSLQMKLDEISAERNHLEDKLKAVNSAYNATMQKNALLIESERLCKETLCMMKEECEHLRGRGLGQQNNLLTTVTSSTPDTMEPTTDSSPHLSADVTALSKQLHEAKLECAQLRVSLAAVESDKRGLSELLTIERETNLNSKMDFAKLLAKTISDLESKHESQISSMRDKAAQAEMEHAGIVARVRAELETRAEEQQRAVEERWKESARSAEIEHASIVAKLMDQFAAREANWLVERSSLESKLLASPVSGDHVTVVTVDMAVTADAAVSVGVVMADVEVQVSDDLVNSVESLEQRLTEMETMLAEKETLVQTFKEKLVHAENVAQQRESAEVSSQVRVAAEALSRSRAEAEHLRREATTLSFSNTSLSAELKQARTQSADQQETIAKLQTLVDTAKTTEAYYVTRLTDVEGVNAFLKDSLVSTERLYEGQISLLKQEATKSASALQRIETEKHALLAELASEQQSNHRHKAQLADAHTQLYELTLQYESQVRELVLSKAAMQSLEERCNAADEEIRKQTAALEGLEARVTTAETERNNFGLLNALLEIELSNKVDEGESLKEALIALREQQKEQEEMAAEERSRHMSRSMQDVDCQTDPEEVPLNATDCGSSHASSAITGANSLESSNDNGPLTEEDSTCAHGIAGESETIAASSTESAFGEGSGSETDIDAVTAIESATFESTASDTTSGVGDVIEAARVGTECEASTGEGYVSDAAPGYLSAVQSVESGEVALAESMEVDPALTMPLQVENGGGAEVCEGGNAVVQLEAEVGALKALIHDLECRLGEYDWYCSQQCGLVTQLQSVLQLRDSSIYISADDGVLNEYLISALESKYVCEDVLNDMVMRTVADSAKRQESPHDALSPSIGRSSSAEVGNTSPRTAGVSLIPRISDRDKKEKKKKSVTFHSDILASQPSTSTSTPVENASSELAMSGLEKTYDVGGSTGVGGFRDNDGNKVTSEEQTNESRSEEEMHSLVTVWADEGVPENVLGNVLGAEELKALFVEVQQRMKRLSQEKIKLNTALQTSKMENEVSE